MYFISSITIIYLSANINEGIISSLLLFIIVQGGVWLSSKLAINFNIITIPSGILFLYLLDIYFKGSPIYIFMMLLFVYINFFVKYKMLRFIYLLVALFFTVKMVHPEFFADFDLQIVSTYIFLAYTLFFLFDYFKKDEGKLVYRNKILNDVFNSSPMPIMLTDSKGDISMINDSCLELFGFTSEQLKGKSLRHIFHFETDQRSDELLRYFKNAISENKLMRMEEEYKKPNGENITLKAEIKPMMLNDKKYILFVCQDITKELQLRKEIQRTHKLYKTMAENIPNSKVYMFDRQLRFMLVEGGELNKEGGIKNKFAGKTFYETFSNDLIPILEQYFKATLMGVESSIEINQNGKDYVYYFLPVRAENLQIMSGIALAINITELKETQTEVGIKNKMIDDYAHKASHVVRRPIAQLLGLVEILRDDHSSEEDKKTAIKYIYDSIKELDDHLKEAAVVLNQ